jgi:spore coat polysaccharide biosynthesis protein SpsF
MNTRVAAIIQARMASSRLPGKVLMEIEGIPMLGRVVSRTRRATTVTQVLVATSTEAADEAIAAYCHGQGISVFRGSHFDVLDRYYSAALHAQAEIVVRITADCPLIDARVIDSAVKTLEGEGAIGFDFVATRLPPPWKRTFPIGLDVEVCAMRALQRAWSEAQAPEEREHVMPYLYKGVHLEPLDALMNGGTSLTGMRIAVLDCEADLGAQRWTVDTTEDLEFVRHVYASFGGRDDFSWQDVARLLQAKPELLRINSTVRHKTLGDLDDRAMGPGTS